VTPTQGLIIGLVVAFSAGVYCGRVQREPVSTLPSNFDATSAIVGEKAARAEAAAYQALLTRALDNGCRPVEAH
jgi:hypothetical protein